MLENNTEKAVSVIAIIAGMVSFLVYLRALSCGFVNWEDQDYILNNTVLRTLDGDMLVRVFTNMSVYGFWLPLTYISFAIDYHFWGFNPLGYHLINISLHAVNAGLIVLLADKLYKKKYVEGGILSGDNYLYWGMLLLSGLLFAIHPARVESVAWVSERKDVLNGVFLIGSMIYYIKYQQKKDGELKVGMYRDYFSSVLLFLLSLCAKPSSVVFPLMLLVLDWYPLGRLQKRKIVSILLEKVPYLLLSVIISVITILMVLKYDKFLPFTNFPLDQRVIASGNSIFEYFKLMLYPVGIVPHYALPKKLPQIYVVKGIAVIFVFCVCIYWRKKAPWFSAIILLFTIPLLPVLPLLANGTVQVILLCRYTYIPSMVPSIVSALIIVTAYHKIQERRQRVAASVLIGVTASVIVFYVFMTQRLIDVWKDSGTMWTRVIAYHPFDKAYFYRGLYYVDSTKDYKAAIADYSKSLEIATQENLPDIYNIYAFRGEAFAKAGRYVEAITDFNIAISLFPHRLYYYHRGMALYELGRIKDAEEDLARADRVNGQMYWMPFGSPL